MSTAGTTLAVFTRLGAFGPCGSGSSSGDDALLEDLRVWLRAPKVWLARQGLRADQPEAHRLFREHGLASAVAARATGTIDTVALFSPPRARPCGPSPAPPPPVAAGALLARA